MERGEKIFDEEPKKSNVIEREKVLEMNPEELVNFLSELDDKNELKEFLEKSAEDESLVAMLSYWEKWLEKRSCQIG